jgi:hypothetical protein
VIQDGFETLVEGRIHHHIPRLIFVLSCRYVESAYQS